MTLGFTAEQAEAIIKMCSSKTSPLSNLALGHLIHLEVNWFVQMVHVNDPIQKDRIQRCMTLWHFASLS